MFAAANGLSEFFTLLLAHNADVAAEDEDKCTALHLAARNGHLGVARELIDAGAAKEAQDVGLWTPLVWAAYKVCDHPDAEHVVDKLITLDSEAVNVAAISPLALALVQYSHNALTNVNPLTELMCFVVSGGNVGNK